MRPEFVAPETSSETSEVRRSARGIRRSALAFIINWLPLNGRLRRATYFPAISWGAWLHRRAAAKPFFDRSERKPFFDRQKAGLRGESQPIEPDPGHAGGGRDAGAGKRTAEHCWRHFGACAR